MMLSYDLHIHIQTQVSKHLHKQSAVACDLWDHSTAEHSEPHDFPSVFWTFDEKTLQMDRFAERNWKLERLREARQGNDQETLADGDEERKVREEGGRIGGTKRGDLAASQEENGLMG